MSKSIKIMCICVSALLMLTSCIGNKSNPNISDSNLSVSSENQTISAQDAVKVYAGESKLDEIFILESVWNGNEYKNKSSLNRLMMEKYALNDEAVPEAADGCIISFVFGEEIPNAVLLTRYGNTLKANSGIPYDITEVELNKSEYGKYSFELKYNKFTMLYFTLGCSWDNGNSAEYCFAVRLPNEKK